MTQDHARQDLQTNGSDVRTRAPPEKAVKTPPHALSGTEDGTPPHDKYTDETPQTPPNECRTRTSQHFLEQHPDRAHTDKSPTHQRLRGSDLTGLLKLPP